MPSSVIFVVYFNYEWNNFILFLEYEEKISSSFPGQESTQVNFRLSGTVFQETQVPGSRLRRG
jgi:hypothetical protein